MRIFIAALALTSLIASASLTQTANAAPVSPASSAFGSNGYYQLGPATSESLRGSSRRTSTLALRHPWDCLA
jgi:hypothetical protein